MARKMTDEQIEACYELGKQAYEEKISKKDAIGILVDVHKKNEASADMYITFFLMMMRGKICVPSINKDALKYYCENVLRDYGVDRLKIFLEGLELHIKRRKGKAPAFRTIHNEYSKKAGMPPIF